MSAIVASCHFAIFCKDRTQMTCPALAEAYPEGEDVPERN
jgi:hypothetical protein